MILVNVMYLVNLAILVILVICVIYTFVLAIYCQQLENIRQMNVYIGI